MLNLQNTIITYSLKCLFLKYLLFKITHKKCQ
jgi:hypothetical protein